MVRSRFTKENRPVVEAFDGRRERNLPAAIFRLVWWLLRSTQVKWQVDGLWAVGEGDLDGVGAGDTGGA